MNQAPAGLYGIAPTRPMAAQNTFNMGLGTYASNPNMAAANPLSGLGLTAGSQQLQQNQAQQQMNQFQQNQAYQPYNSQPTFAQPAQNLGMQGANTFGGFAGQQPAPMQNTQQSPQQQNMQAAPMQGGYNLFGGGQDQQNNTGGSTGGATGGGGLL
jgi:hypothetical protein